MESRRILVTCPKACSSYLKEELEELGFLIEGEVATGVFTRGSCEDCVKLNLSLRTGLRVLWEIGNFEARNGDALYRQAVQIEWEKWIPKDGYVSIISSVSNDSVKHTNYPNLKLKDALVDRMRKATGSRPDTGNDPSKAVVFLYWRDEEVCVYLDTSGTPLSNRGYRVSPAKAPMRENLAASVIRAMSWDRNTTFVNPMCGSGTLAIEAAQLALGMPAGVLRDNFAFMHLRDYDASSFERLRKEQRENSKTDLGFEILASDKDPKAIEAAKRNAKIARVDHLIRFETRDFRQATIPQEPGVIILNPEYGERLGDEKKLISTYQEIGDLFKRKAPGYWGYVFTGNRNLGKRVGLKAKRRIEFYNGPIECRLLEYELYSGTRDPRRSEKG